MRDVELYRLISMEPGSAFGCRRAARLVVSPTAVASFRSSVSNPSVNQP